jgi:hypothetical protein
MDGARYSCEVSQARRFLAPSFVRPVEAIEGRQIFFCELIRARDELGQGGNCIIWLARLMEVAEQASEQFP